MWPPWACGRKSVDTPEPSFPPCYFLSQLKGTGPSPTPVCTSWEGCLRALLQSQADQESHGAFQPFTEKWHSVCHFVKGFFQISRIQAWDISPLLGYWSWKIKPILPLFFHSLSTVSWVLPLGTWSSWILILCVYISYPLIDDDLLDASVSSRVSHTVHSI